MGRKTGLGRKSKGAKYSAKYDIKRGTAAASKRPTDGVQQSKGGLNTSQEPGPSTRPQQKSKDVGHPNSGNILTEAGSLLVEWDEMVLETGRKRIHETVASSAQFVRSTGKAMQPNAVCSGLTLLNLLSNVRTSPSKSDQVYPIQLNISWSSNAILPFFTF